MVVIVGDQCRLGSSVESTPRIDIYKALKVMCDSLKREERRRFFGVLTCWQCLFSAQLLYVLSSGVIKASFSFSLLRIVVTKKQKILIYCILASTVAFTIFYFFYLLFACHPISYFWNRVLERSGGHCAPPRNVVAATYTHGAISLVNDIAMVIIPIFVVKDLQMDLKSKITVTLIFAIGSL